MATTLTRWTRNAAWIVALPFLLVGVAVSGALLVVEAWRGGWASE